MDIDCRLNSSMEEVRPIHRRTVGARVQEQAQEMSRFYNTLPHCLLTVGSTVNQVERRGIEPRYRT